MPGPRRGEPAPLGGAGKLRADSADTEQSGGIPECPRPVEGPDGSGQGGIGHHLCVANIFKKPEEPSRFLIWLTTWTLVVIALLFLLLGLVVLRDLEVAWELLATIQSPAPPEGSSPTAFVIASRWILSCIGYLALPAVIGLLAAASSELFIGKRTLTEEQAREKARAEIARMLGLRPEDL